MRWRYDDEVCAGYLYLDEDAPIARQVEFASGRIVVDVDESGHPVGVEVLFPDTRHRNNT